MNLALFDFDGTISTRELFPDFVRFALSRRQLAAGTALLAPLVAGYRLGWVPGTTVRSCTTAFGFRGASEAAVRAAGERFHREVLVHALRPVALERIAWHRAQGDAVAVVSGAYDAYLAPWCREQGLDLICSRLESRAGVLTGRYLGAQCVGAEKARQVRERYRLADHPVVYAYGDTHEDREMLDLAQRRFFRWQEV